MRNTLAVLVLKLLFKYYFNIKSVAKGKLAHEFSTCYLEFISFNLIVTSLENGIPVLLIQFM